MQILLNLRAHSVLSPCWHDILKIIWKHHNREVIRQSVFPKVNSCPFTHFKLDVSVEVSQPFIICFHKIIQCASCFGWSSIPPAADGTFLLWIFSIMPVPLWALLMPIVLLLHNTFWQRITCLLYVHCFYTLTFFWTGKIRKKFLHPNYKEQRDLTHFLGYWSYFVVKGMLKAWSKAQNVSNASTYFMCASVASSRI